MQEDYVEDDRLGQTLHSPGLIMPGQFGPIRRVLLWRTSACFTRTLFEWWATKRCNWSCGCSHVLLRNSFRDANDQGNLSIQSLENRGCSSRRRHVDHGSIAVRVLLRFGDTCKNRQAQMRGSSLVWRHTTNHLGAVTEDCDVSGSLSVQGQLRIAYSMACCEWKVPFLPVKPWHSTRVFLST